MNFYLWSDLHTDFGDFEFHRGLYRRNYPLIIAGDLGTSKNVPEELLKEVSDYFENVIVVLGNHDFYGARIDDVLDNYRELSSKYGFHFLEDSSVVIDDVEFIGSVLWTDMNNANVLDVNNAHIHLNDFKHIRDFKNGMWTSRGRTGTLRWLDRNANSREYLNNKCRENSEQKKIVITHHAPHPICVDSKYKGQGSNYLYHCTDKKIEDLFFDDLGILCWVHGHMHTQNTKELNNIPIFRNARGYIKYERTADTFAPDRVFTV